MKLVNKEYTKDDRNTLQLKFLTVKFPRKRGGPNPLTELKKALNKPVS